MTKKWIASLLLFAGLQAGAVDADFSGEYRLRANTGDVSVSDVSASAVGNSLRDTMNMRTKVSSSFRPSEAFEGNLTLYNHFRPSTNADFMFLGYGDWMISDELMLRAGRTTYQIAKGEVIGVNDYEDFPVAMDGLFLTHSSESLGADVALVRQYSQPNTAAAVAPQSSLLVVSVDARSFPEWVKTLNLHLISDTSDFNKSRAGLTLAGGASNAGYKLTAATSSLTDVANAAVENSLVDAKLSYTFDWSDSKLKLYLGYHMDGASYDSFLYNKHNYAGLLDAAKWGNGLSYGSAGAAYMMDADSKLGLSALYFTADKAADSIKKGNVEIDLYYKQSFDSEVSLLVWAGMMNADSMTAKAEAALRMRF